VSSGDALAFRAAIMDYYSDAPLLAEASHRARLHTAARFEWRRVTDNYVRAIRDVLSKRSA
jgi:hypothetical protein